MARVCAFKDNYNNYYVFTSSGNFGTISFNSSSPNYSEWMDATLLNTLTTDQLVKTYNKDLIIHSDIEDDVYNVNISNYDIMQTTDTSHFTLSGYAFLKAMTFTNTSTTCHVILSFDGRKSWWYYDITNSRWVKTYIGQIYTDKSNTVAEINTLTKDIFDLKFKKHCTLDFAIAINNSESFGQVTLTLPPNQPPQIIKLQLRSDPDTHKKKIKIYAEVDDLEGDDISFKILRTNSVFTDEMINYDDITLDKQKAPAILDNSNENIRYNFEIDPVNIEIGSNVFTFVFTDEKGASSTGQISINKINEEAILTASRISDKLTYSVIDNNVSPDDLDGGWIRISISYTDPDTNKLTEYIFTPGYTDTRTDFTEPIKDDEGWSDFISGPIDLTDTIQIPWKLIKFGVDNTIKVEYKEDIYDAPIKIVELPFVGTYFGLLFINLKDNEPYKIGNKLNEKYYYSNSLGEAIQKLNLGNIYHTKVSETVEIGLINATNNVIPKAVIRGFDFEVGDFDPKHYRLNVSSTDAFVFSSLSFLTFTDIYPFDPDSSNPDIRRFFVKLQSLDDTNWEIDDKVTVTSDEVTPVTI